MARKETTKKKTAGTRTVTDIVMLHRDELAAAWLEDIKKLAGTDTVELMAEEPLRNLTKDLLATAFTARPDRAARDSRRRYMVLRQIAAVDILH